MIKLQVIGNLGKDCVVNNVNGKTVINFSVAHTEKFKNAQGQQQDKSIWCECNYWTDRTAIAPYLLKGTQVHVDGTPDVRTYIGKDGQKGFSLTLRVASLQLLGSKQQDQQGSQANYQNQASTFNQPAATSSMANEISEPADDLPF